MSRSRMGKLAASVVALMTLVIAANGVAVAAPAVARNGRIAYSTGFLFPDPDLSGHSQVFTVLPNGTGTRQLTHVSGTTQAGAPDWSPDGARILYVSNASGRFQVWLMRADGSGQHRLVDDPGFDAFQPRWSPDGRRLVFSRCETFGTIPDCQLAVVHADGTGLHLITHGTGIDSSPSFSPDGRSIAFDGNRGGLESAIWSVRPDGSGLRRLTSPALEAFWPSWSPDGSHLAFTGPCCLPVNSQIYTMRADGSGVKQVTHFRGGNLAGFANYSPDGTKFVFFATGSQGDLGLDVIDVDGSGIRRLVSNPVAVIADWGPRL
jgi:Tol biopolymer transport system component